MDSQIPWNSFEVLLLGDHCTRIRGRADAVGVRGSVTADPAVPAVHVPSDSRRKVRAHNSPSSAWLYWTSLVIASPSSGRRDFVRTSVALDSAAIVPDPS